MTLSTSSFIEFALEKKVLQFGDFVTKAGRNSPYFFNLGAFNDGDSLKLLGEFYANKIIDTKLDFDLIFGPAYKGIPLVSSISIALSNKNINIPFAFNRKEAKSHGERGDIIGSEIKDKVLVIDDVISAGTSINESHNLINLNGGHMSGVIVAIDRQEKGQGELSAIQEVERDFDTQVVSIVSLTDLVDYLSDKTDMAEHLANIKQYRLDFGI